MQAARRARRTRGDLLALDSHSQHGPALNETISGLRGVRPSWPSRAAQASAPYEPFAARRSSGATCAQISW
jgi:hypothetical protein